MDRDDALLATRSALRETAGQLVGLLRAQRHLDHPLGGGSRWTVRQAALHVGVYMRLNLEIANGTASPIGSLNRSDLATDSAALMADIAESKPRQSRRSRHGRRRRISGWHRGSFR